MVYSSQEPGIPFALRCGKRSKVPALCRQITSDLFVAVKPFACRACHATYYRSCRLMAPVVAKTGLPCVLGLRL